MSPVRHLGPVRVVDLPHPPGDPAEPVARAWLADELGLPEAAVAFDRDAHGRPQLALDGLDCNWSHSGGRLAIALARGAAVGIDIERPRPRPRALELARRFFAAHEADALAALDGPDREAAFLRLWCAKEAVLKAHGRGLAFGLDRLCFDATATPPRLVALDPELGPAAAWGLAPLELDGLCGMVAWRTGASGA